MKIKRKSVISGVIRERDIPVDPDGYALWQDGLNINEAMPYLNSTDACFILAGITEEEWKREFAAT